MKLRSCCVVVFALVLSSCATSYQKGSFTGGYSEKKVSDSAYVVTFSGNGFASKDRIYYFWLYRCAELTIQEGYGLYVIHSNRSQSLNIQPEASAKPALYSNSDRGGFVKTHGGGGVIIIPGSGTGGATKWTYSATVLMYKQPLPQEVLWGIDAAQTVALLKAYVTSNGGIQPPNREDLFRKAFVAHARISIGEDATAEFDSEAANVDQPADLPIRTADAIADAVSASRLIALHAIYRVYISQLKTLDPRGEVVLEFTVTPNGQVRACYLTSSSIVDRDFTNAILLLVRQTEFSPQSVAITRVTHFRITFEAEPQMVIPAGA